jgi:hypothetical protein
MEHLLLQRRLYNLAVLAHDEELCQLLSVRMNVALEDTPGLFEATRNILDTDEPIVSIVQHMVHDQLAYPVLLDSWCTMVNIIADVDTEEVLLHRASTFHQSLLEVRGHVMYSHIQRRFERDVVRVQNHLKNDFYMLYTTLCSDDIYTVGLSLLMEPSLTAILMEFNDVLHVNDTNVDICPLGVLLIMVGIVLLIMVGVLSFYRFRGSRNTY